MKQNRSPFGLLIFILLLGASVAMAYATNRLALNAEVIGIAIGALVLALAVSSAIRVADPVLTQRSVRGVAIQSKGQIK